MKRFRFGGEQPLDPASDPFYDAVPPGGEYVVHDGTASPPERLIETATEAAVRREGLRKAIQEIFEEANSAKSE